jgi:hypothetical protein
MAIRDSSFSFKLNVLGRNPRDERTDSFANGIARKDQAGCRGKGRSEHEPSGGHHTADTNRGGGNGSLRLRSLSIKGRLWPPVNRKRGVDEREFRRDLSRIPPAHPRYLARLIGLDETEDVAQ